MGSGALLGAIPSPNLWQNPAVYEIENAAFDPDGRVEDALRTVASWTGARVLEVGCGTGFHLPGLAAEAASVVGVEPHHGSAAAARRRTRALPNVRVVDATAQHLPLPDGSVDLALARWAYFFGPGCEPGLAELARVVRRSGTSVVVDTDAAAGSWGHWFRRANPAYDPAVADDFFSRRGWTSLRLSTRFVFASRNDLERVAGIEFGTALARQLVATHRGVEVDFQVVVRVLRH